tara:strand:- start:671 stop:895 length:225 start_codon:yes stop_codon:yes gene_type:complete
MNFNHLFDQKRIKTIGSCRQECYWAPTGHIRAIVGGKINVTMYCKHCSSREDLFLTEKEFRMHKKMLEGEVGIV